MTAGEAQRTSHRLGDGDRRVRHGEDLGSPVHARWLWGGGCCRFSAHIQFGRAGTREISIEVTHDEIRRDAAALRALPAEEADHHEYAVYLPHGRGQTRKALWIPRDMLLEIADALAGALDADDAGHRFYHWESPTTPRPCTSCRETLDAEDARVDAIRSRFIDVWARKLGTERARVERLLAAHRRLPTKKLRPR